LNGILSHYHHLSMLDHSLEFPLYINTSTRLDQLKSCKPNIPISQNHKRQAQLRPQKENDASLITLSHLLARPFNQPRTRIRRTVSLLSSDSHRRRIRRRGKKSDPLRVAEVANATATIALRSGVAKVRSSCSLYWFAC
jgi:hypothetical protein